MLRLLRVAAGLLDRPQPVRFANALAGLGSCEGPLLRMRIRSLRLLRVAAGGLAGLNLFATRMRWPASPLEPGRLNRGARLLCCSSYDSGGGATKRKIGTGEAIAFAFIVGFQPLGGSIRKSNYNSDRKSKLSAQVAALIGISPPTT
ncbi:hypothetical protein PSTEL_03960 [Paenibacillus stellifer]|uniref:Uncharacterized protein n=1 Tax=Paenibacillus stellifer TaxID=169760 RepID=A0A089LNG0_9BACL|nr:hypothetical protein [Paenibacillus stellifer]AIQ62382.1 hypothetical protein PSTEL_03960 [Paenibacillus stellifer]